MTNVCNFSVTSFIVIILGVVTALRRSQLSPRIENVREKVGANGKMCWWKCCDAPFGENRVGSPTSEDGLLDAVKLCCMIKRT